MLHKGCTLSTSEDKKNPRKWRKKNKRIYDEHGQRMGRIGKGAEEGQRIEESLLSINCRQVLWKAGDGGHFLSVRYVLLWEELVKFCEDIRSCSGPRSL